MSISTGAVITASDIIDSGAFFHASNTEKNSSPSSVTSSSATYTKLKEIAIDNISEYVRSVRVRFGMQSISGGVPAYARLYRNATATGIERSVSVANVQYFTEDFTTGWASGNLIQIYGKVTTASSGRLGVQDMSFRYGFPSIGVIYQDP